MNMMKRVLALSLALVLIFHLLPNVQTAEASTDLAASEVTSPVIVYEDSFELGESFTAGGNSDQPTTADKQNYWHGATPNTLPNNTDLFTQDWQSGSVIISGGVGGAWDGDSCISLTNDPNHAAANDRIYLNYNLMNVIKSGKLTLKDNTMYVLSIWVKYAAGTTYTSKIMVKNSQTFTTENGQTSNQNPFVEDKSNNTTEWTKVEVPFMYHSGKTSILVDLEMQGNSATGTIYFDLLQITELVDAEAMTVDGAQVNVGEQVTLKPTMTPANASTTVTWSSSNSAIATVDANGVVTGVSGGTVTITAKAAVKNYDFVNRKYLADKATYTATCEVTVLGSVAGIILNKTEITLEKGNKEQLTATVNPSELQSSIVWSSADSTIASVDAATGEVTAVSVGTTKITAKAGGFEASCTVTVNKVNTGDAAIEDGSFEQSVDNTVSNHISSKGDVKWNGADLSSNWSTYFDRGEVKLSVIKDASAAQDGQYFLEFTPNGSGRANLQYKIPAAELKSGHEYVIKVWFKGTADTDITSRIQAVYLTSGNATTSGVLTEEWTCLEHRFTYRQVAGRDPMVINIGMMGDGTTGSMFIDNVSITHIPREDAPATGIQFSADEVDMSVGATKQLSVVAIPEDTTDTLIYEWKSSDETIATVDSNGKVTARKEGKVTIKASAGGFEATCTVYVKDMSPDSLKIEDGSFEQSTDNALSGYVSTKGGTVAWNGAELSRHWNTLLDEGNVNFEIVKDASIAQDGQYCVKITPEGIGRGGIQYQLPTSMLVEGAEYVIKVWFKGTGDNDYKSRIQAVYLKSGNLTSGATLTDEWTCLEHRFIYSYDSSRDPMLINIGMGATGTTGSIYIDNISIERVPKADSVTLDTYETWLEVGQTHQLVTTILPAELDLKAVYKTSDGSVASVDTNGKITALAPGQATIKVVATGGTSAECVVYVVDKYIPTTSVAMDKSTLNITPGWSEKLTVAFTPANASNQNVTWSSSNTDIVTVSDSGVITALRSGTATITATSGAFSATCAVTVADDASFPSKTGFLRVDFGICSTIHLNAILAGNEYTVISQPVNGMVTLNGSKISYTSYTWLMEDQEFTDQSYGDFAHAEYTDSVLIAVKNGNKTATIELKITINPIADLFYDNNGNWITDVDLLFSEEKLAAIKAQLTDTNSLYYELLQNLIAQLQLKISRKPTLYVKPNYAAVSASYDTDSRSNAETATDFMIGYLLTKDVPGYEELNKQYLDKSIEWLTAMLDYPFWGTLGYQNNDLAGGHHLFATALAYHWLKDELKDLTVDQRIGTDGSSEEAWNNTVVVYEDQPFLEALEMRLWQAGRDMYSRNYTYDCYVMNHLHVRMGGLSLAATALREQPNLTAEQQEELLRWNAMVLYKDGNAMRFAMPDGTSQEGVPYWEYGAEWLIKAGMNIRAALGIDMFAMTNVFQNSGDYLLYNLLPTDHWEKSSSILNVGDSPLYHYNGPSHILRFIAGEYGDQNAQWLAQQVEDAGINNTGSALWLSLFVADPGVEAVAPSLDETLHWFEDMDHVIARSDWSGNEDFLSIKSGIPTGKNLYEKVLSGEYTGDPDAGHAHPDANHITLYANGEFLLKDDGYADKFTANHNTLLVNGKGQLGEGSDWLLETKYMEYQAEPFIKLAISNDVYDYIVGDATEAYAPDLGLYTYERNVLWLKQEQVLLVVDNIVAEDSTQLELRWSTGLEQVFEVCGGYMAVGKSNVMNIYPFTESSATSYETVTLNADDVTYEGEILRQQYTGSSWQNAIAFSWNDTGLETAEVCYNNAGNNVHQFEVGGKIYSINVASNQITVSSGELAESDPSAASNSSIAAIELNGQAVENFDPAVTEYEVELNKKVTEENLKVYTAARGATVSVKINLRQITITCVSRDGKNSTVYVLKIKEANKATKLEIVGAVSDVAGEEYDLASSYDGIVTVGNTGAYWIAQSPQSGKISVTYDLGEFVRIQRVDLALHDSHSQENYYDLLVSLDGETWITVHEAQSVDPTADISGNAHAFRTILRNQSLTARYVRVVLRGYVKGSVDNRDKAGIYNGINEIAIYGWKLTEEMRQLTIVNASTDVFREGYDLASTYDGIVTLGNAGSYWTVQAPENGKISVIYDLGTLSMIQKIDLAMQNSYGRTNYYDLLISEDGKNWTVIQEMAGVAPTFDISENAHAFRTILEGQALLARYVKIILRGNVDGLIDNRDTFGVFSGINEITFYGATLSTDPTFNVKPPLTDESSDEDGIKRDIPTRPRTNTGTDSSDPSETEPADDGDVNWITWLVLAFAVVGVAAVICFVLYVKKKNEKAPPEQDA